MKRRIFSALLCLCILSVITLIAARVPRDAEGNREGMLLVLQKEISYVDGKMSLSTEYEYDSRGRVIKTVTDEPSAARERYNDYEYDENGHVIREHQAYSYGEDIYWENQYDSHGNILQTAVYYEYDNKTRQINYEYDAEGNLLLKTEIERSENNPDGSLSIQESYEYDAQGNIVQMIKEDTSSDFGGIFQHIYKYDAQGNRIQDICCHDGGGWQYEYGYDMRGNMVWEIDYDFDKNITRQYRYAYDAQDNLIQEYIYDSDGDLKYQYQYEYDAQGNKISETRYVPYEHMLRKDYSTTFSRKYVWIAVEQ